MDDDQATRLLDQLADGVPVGPAPVGELVRRGRAARRRRRYMVVGAAAASLVVGTGVALAMTGDTVAPQANPLPTPSQQVPVDPTGDRRGELPQPGAASCVEVYDSGRAIAEQAVFAFDGVITDITTPGLSNRPGSGELDLVSVTFHVEEWFAGGSGPEVTVDLYPPLSEDEGRSEDAAPSYAPGSRLLVSGSPRWGGAPLDDPIAWMCGFTQYYDQETAEAWRTGG